jgi:CubicO group peptidase (beta-lactamase class C family)
MEGRMMSGRTISALMTAVALAAMAASGAAQTPPPVAAVASTPAQRADALLSAFTADKPGLAVLVMKGGQPIYERYLGAADLEHGQAVGAATRFHVASVSKQFTAFAIADLAREGKIDLSADIRTYLPEMPDFGRKITVADLLHHTSGLRDQWGLFVLSGADFQDYLKQRSILSMARAQTALNFDPGSEYEYCNTGYSLAALIVERVSGKSFRSFLAERVFTPLGMADTLVYDNATELVPNRAMSYTLQSDGKVRLVRLNYNNYGATSLHTTPRDLAKWGQELLHPKVLDAGVIGAMQQPGKLTDGTPINYGLGLVSQEMAGRKGIGHGGSDAGYRASFGVFPAEDVTIVVLSNGQADVGGLTEKLTDVLLNGGTGAPQTWPEAPASPEQVAKLAGFYVTDRTPMMELRADGAGLKRFGGGPSASARFMPGGGFYTDRPTNTFTVAANGRDLEYRSSNGGKPLVWRRIDKVAPTPAELAGLAGVYRSDELDITYRLAVVNGTLQLSSLRTDPAPLFPTARDMFDAPSLFGGLVKVGRDKAGKPDRLLVSLMGGRVRDVVLRRVG